MPTMIWLLFTAWVVAMPEQVWLGAQSCATAAKTTSNVFSDARDRDKTGINDPTSKTIGTQSVTDQAFASSCSFRAEGMGLEPTTGCPAPEFQSGC